MKIRLSIALRAVLLICGWFAVQDAFVAAGGPADPENLLYFTYQSNLWVLLITAVYLVFAIQNLLGGNARIPHVLAVARYTVAVAISITMIVYWAILAPTRPIQSVMTWNSQLLHTVVPLLFIADFLLFNRGEPVRLSGVLWTLVLPLYYLIFTFVFQAATHYTFSSGRHYPYYILDVDKFGWFGSPAGMGVFWWLVMILCLTLALGFLFRFAQSRTAKEGQDG